MNDLHVPAFARLVEYAGLWSMEPAHFADLWHMAETLDLYAHVRDGAESLRSSIELQPGPNGKSLAVIKMTGLLMKQASSIGGTSTIQLRRDIRNAASDPNVGGILLAVDSPGGTVAGTDDLAREVKAAGRQKPVWAHVDDLGASAAYWVASQTDRITANSPTALIGSIGTLQVIHDHSGAAEKAGIRTMVFSTGPLKGTGTLGSKVTDEQSAHVQGLVNSVQQSFDAAVQKGRGLSNAQLTAIRHGGVLTAPDALDKGLIDAIQPLGKTLAQLAETVKTGQMPAAEHEEQPPPELPAAVDKPGALGVLPTVRRSLPLAQVG